jgi:signal peptidase II
LQLPKTFAGWISLIVLPLLVCDQVIKVWIKLNFAVGQRASLVPGILELQFIENEGMAFGWALPGVTGKLVLTSFRLIAAVGIGFYLNKLIRSEVHKGLLACVSFVWAGAIGNIIDSAVYGQLFTRSSWGMTGGWAGPSEGYAPFLMGNVVDMFHFVVRWPAWFPIDSMAGREIFPPIWNLADAAISCGVIAILIGQRAFFRDVQADAKQEGSESVEKDSTPE